MKKTLLALALCSSFGCRCTTHKNVSKSLESDSVRTENVSTPRIQPSWQDKFEADVKEAGNGAEGWALFSDSGMGHTGQQLVIRDSNSLAKLCYATQATDKCSYTALSAGRFATIEDLSAKSDALAHRPLKVFDAMTMEYVHLRWQNNKLSTLGRVHFMVDSKPLPENYNSLMDHFINLNK